MNDILAAIDAETAKCICGNEVPADGASLDYCSPACQYGYSGPSDSYRIGNGIPDGRTLNDQVAAEFARNTPVEHSGDAMHSNYTPDPLTEAIRQAEEEWVRNRSAETIANLSDAIRDAYEPRPTRVMWVPTVADPNAPTAAELSQGIDLTASVHTTREWMEALEAVNASISLSAIEFMEQVAAATGISALEAARVFNEFATAFDNEPLTGEEFRRRALEHQQQRGTGPAERRQRYPRDHGPRRHR
jgi:hypothetical protein